MLKTILIDSFIWLSGFVVGALSRQPKINELKKQVESLKAEVTRLQGCIKKQKNQISELKKRYIALKGFQFLKQIKQREYLKGSLMYQYALKDYLEILIDADHINKVNMNKGEIKFYNAFGKILNAGQITDKDRSVIIEYISEKYKSEIDNFQEPDFDKIMDYIS